MKTGCFFSRFTELIGAEPTTVPDLTIPILNIKTTSGLGEEKYHFQAGTTKGISRISSSEVEMNGGALIRTCPAEMVSKSWT